jgi:hypothetical protein
MDEGNGSSSSDSSRNVENEVSQDDDLSISEMVMEVLVNNEPMYLSQVLERMDDDMEQSPSTGYKGSVAGRQNVERDFVGAHERLVAHYFNGSDSTYSRDQFCRRFRVSPEIFQRIYSQIANKGEFHAPTRCNAAGKHGIHPLVRMTAVFRVLAYGDASDREDEHFQIGESTLDAAVTDFCKQMVLTFGDIYLNRSPNANEKNRILKFNENRGFPGLFASWDCKHFVWDMCPFYLQGQHKGHHAGGKNTIILEAIADGWCYLWFINFGDPGSLNDINVLDKSSIVGNILRGTLDIKTEPYRIGETVRDWMYFLVDGIYPNWAIFVKTIPDTARTNPQRAFFSSRQEAVRKDVERAFGILVKKFHILHRPIRRRKIELIRNILYTCVILHNMCCEERENATRNEIPGEETLVENFHDLYNDGVPNNQQNTASLFGQSSATTQGTGTVEDDASVIHAMMLQRINSLMTLDSNMTDATKHAQLQNDLINHVRRQS